MEKETLLIDRLTGSETNLTELHAHFMGHYTLTELPVHIPSGLFFPESGCKTQGFSKAQWPERPKRRVSPLCLLQQHHHLSELCVKQQTHLNVRVEGVARELKTYLVITLRKRKKTDKEKNSRDKELSFFFF